MNGTAPTGDLASLYGSAQTLEFTYNPGDNVSLAPGSAALASVTGSNSGGMAFIEISNNANPFAASSQTYFEGSVQSGEKIFANAMINPLTNTATASGSDLFSTASGSKLFGFVFSSQAAFDAHSAPVQTMTYGTSSNSAMHIGDTVGSLKLAGYVGSTGGYLVS